MMTKNIFFGVRVTFSSDNNTTTTTYFSCHIIILLVSRVSLLHQKTKSIFWLRKDFVSNNNNNDDSNGKETFSGYVGQDVIMANILTRNWSIGMGTVRSWSVARRAHVRARLDAVRTFRYRPGKRERSRTVDDCSGSSVFRVPVCAMDHVDS